MANHNYYYVIMYFCIQIIIPCCRCRGLKRRRGDHCSECGVHSNLACCLECGSVIVLSVEDHTVRNVTLLLLPAVLCVVMAGDTYPPTSSPIPLTTCSIPTS